MLDFWDSVTPDTDEWKEKIAGIHPNRFIREYTRYKYILTSGDFVKAKAPLPEGYILESVNLTELKQRNYSNANRIHEWAEAWGSEEKFDASGCGCYIRKDDCIVSWSLSDCCASAVVQRCFEKGYNQIEWLCVSSNSGSKAIAESLGFKLVNKYVSYSSYPPIENLTDLDESGWYEWGTYLENASKEEPELSLDCLCCFIKANAVEKTMTIIDNLIKSGIDYKLQQLKNDIASFQKEGLCSAFNTLLWQKFVEELDPL
ncbi:hypothetical protein D3C76_876060 [compost metagenome]